MTTPQIPGFSDLTQIGEGGLGVVYRGVRDSTGATVAIKVLRNVADPQLERRRTQRESTAMVELQSHPHVIQIQDSLKIESGTAMVMEYAANGSVYERFLANGESLPIAEVLVVAHHVASALTAAHALGMVHRDVKPQNLLIDTYGQVKLADFGIATLSLTDELSERTSSISLRYASPEDVEDDEEVASPADIYSLGATLLLLLRGSTVTWRERIVGFNYGDATDELPDGVEARQRQGLIDLLEACLQRDPSLRPTAPEVRSTIESIIAQSQSQLRALPVDPVPNRASFQQSPVDSPTVSPSPSPNVFPALGDEELRFTDAATDGVGPPLNQSPAASSLPESLPMAPPGSPSEATIVRPPPRQLPPRPQRSTPTKRSKVPIMLGGAVAIVVLLVAGWVLFDRSAETSSDATGRDDVAAPTSTSVSPSTVSVAKINLIPAPADLPDLTADEVRWPSGSIGECLVYRDGAAVTVSCDQPHDVERFGVGVHTAFGDDYDAAAITAASQSACTQAFIEYVYRGESEARATQLEIFATQPSVATWGNGDRSYQCWLWVEGQRLIGSAADTGW